MALDLYNRRDMLFGVLL